MTRRSRILDAAKLALLGGAVCLAMASPAKAGLFEVLFGRPTPPPAPRFTENPFEMTISPHRRRKPATVVKRDGETSPKLHVQQPLDVAGDPEWILKDPTLRRGDIIVRADRVIVFQGARGAARLQDFVDLAISSLVSKAQRQKIMTITEAPREPLVSYQPPALVKVTVPAEAQNVTVPDAAVGAKPAASTATLVKTGG